MNNEIVRLDDVVGVDVVNPQGENLGSIETLALNKTDGKVSYVVLSFGGILGMGDKWFALPWRLISYNPSLGKFVLKLDKEKLKNSPGFDKDNWPNMAGTEFQRTIRDYYGDSDLFH